MAGQPLARVLDQSKYQSIQSLRRIYESLWFMDPLSHLSRSQECKWDYPKTICGGHFYIMEWIPWYIMEDPQGSWECHTNRNAASLDLKGQRKCEKYRKPSCWKNYSAANMCYLSSKRRGGSKGRDPNPNVKYVTLHDKRNSAGVIKVKDLKTGRLLWNIWVGPRE